MYWVVQHILHPGQELPETRLGHSRRRGCRLNDSEPIQLQFRLRDRRALEAYGEFRVQATVSMLCRGLKSKLSEPGFW